MKFSLILLCGAYLKCSAVTLEARRGKFFQHPLVADEFFSGKNGGLEFSAYMEGKSDLPNWLHLATTESGAQAILYGTPETNDESTDVTVLVLNGDTYETARKTYRVNIENDKRFTIPVKQTAELWIKNLDGWDMLSNPHKLRDLNNKIMKAFGKRAYLRSLKPATAVGARIPLTKEKVGVIAYIAPRKKPYLFPKGVEYLAQGVQMNSDQCSRNEIVPFDRFFADQFEIDWCKFKMYMMHINNNSDSSIVLSHKGLQTKTNLYSSPYLDPLPPPNTEYEPYEPSKLTRDYFPDWIVFAGLPVILCLLILLLSAVFFGCREGQHWRDYKTPHPQLAEYVSLRQTQSKLRSMDGHRNVNLYTSSPKESRMTQTIRIDEDALGKQTVGEAANAHGTGTEAYEEEEEVAEVDEPLLPKTRPIQRPSPRLTTS